MKAQLSVKAQISINIWLLLGFEFSRGLYNAVATVTFDVIVVIFMIVAMITFLIFSFVHHQQFLH